MSPSSEAERLGRAVLGVLDAARELVEVGARSSTNPDSLLGVLNAAVNEHRAATQAFLAAEAVARPVWSAEDVERIRNIAPAGPLSAGSVARASVR